MANIKACHNLVCIIGMPLIVDCLWIRITPSKKVQTIKGDNLGFIKVNSKGKFILRHQNVTIQISRNLIIELILKSPYIYLTLGNLGNIIDTVNAFLKEHSKSSLKKFESNVFNVHANADHNITDVQVYEFIDYIRTNNLFWVQESHVTEDRIWFQISDRIKDTKSLVLTKNKLNLTAPSIDELFSFYNRFQNCLTSWIS